MQQIEGVGWGGGWRRWCNRTQIDLHRFPFTRGQLLFCLLLSKWKDAPTTTLLLHQAALEGAKMHEHLHASVWFYTHADQQPT